MLRTLFLTLFVCLLLSSCRNSYIFEQTRVLPESGWTHQDTLRFEAVIEDTLRLYHLYLDIGHTTSYSYQNLYLKIYTRFPNGERAEKVLSIDLADKTGQWYGACNSESCDLRVFLQEAAFFDQPGRYVFTIAQHMRVDPLQGVQAVGFSIEDSGEIRKE